jgi:hypothetical protein
MPARRDVDPRLLEAARRGTLTRNSAQGAEERAAVYRVAAERRLAKHPELSARQALGHEAPGDVPPTISFYAAEPARLVTVEGASRRDARRAGVYMRASRDLVDGRIEPKAFERRFRRWKPIAGRQPLADPHAVVALVEHLRAGEEEILFDSGRSRPGRRRRIR